MSLRNRIDKLISVLTDGVYEREEAIKISFLSALAGENIFLYGPPGVAKSLISRRLSEVFESDNYFEYLMQEVSISEEIFEATSESAKFKNDKLKLYEDFLIRLFLTSIQQRENFDNLLQKEIKEIKFDNKLQIKIDELKIFPQKIKQITLSKDVLDIIHFLKMKIEEHNRKTKDIIYISDRRWKRSAYLLKASAYFCNRTKTNIADSFILKHCLCFKPSHKEFISEIVRDAINSVKIDTSISIDTLKDRKKLINNIIQTELYEYDNIIKKNNEKCFEVKLKFENFGKTKIYIPLSKVGEAKFSPLEIKPKSYKKYIKCDFSDKERCIIKIKKEKKLFVPTMRQKENIQDSILIKLVTDIVELGGGFNILFKELKNMKFRSYNPFLKSEEIEFYINRLNKELESVKSEIKDLLLNTTLIER